MNVHPGQKVGLATKLYAQGQPLLSVATDSDSKVGGALEVYSRQRKRETGPVELTPRGGTPETTPSTVPNSNPGTPENPEPNQPQNLDNL